MKRDVLGISTSASWSQPINRAFVLTDKDLQTFYAAGKNWVDDTGNGNPKILCRAALKASKEGIVSDTVTSIIDYTNPHKKQITNITLEMVSEDKNRTFALKFQNEEWPSVISLIVGGKNLRESETPFHRMEAELYDITQWYWVLATRRWIATVLRWTFWIWLVITIMFLSMTIISTVRNSLKTKKAEQQYEYVLKDAPSLRQTAKPSPAKKSIEKISHNETTSWKEVWELISNKNFLRGVGFILVVIFLERSSLYLFPRAIFDMGKGKQRHARLRAIRKWVGGIITTIIVLGLIVPYLKQKIVGGS